MSTDAKTGQAPVPGGEDAPDFGQRFGIRMQATRSRPPKRRWSRQWQAYMESLQMGARIGRGRQYATGGNVRSLDISPGLAVATVRGGAPEPYRCEIRCEAAEGETRSRIAAFLRARPMLLARLLVGDLPEAVETRFRVEGVPLAPSALAPLAVHCTCPDGAAFCKHAAAVLFLLCETFDASPLLLLKFRGLDKTDLYGAIPSTSVNPAILVNPANGVTSVNPANGVNDVNPANGVTSVNPAIPANPPSSFALLPFASGDLIEFPGSLPFWRGESRFAESVQECLDRAAPAAQRRLAGARATAPASGGATGS